MKALDRRFFSFFRGGAVARAERAPSLPIEACAIGLSGRTIRIGAECHIVHRALGARHEPSSCHATGWGVVLAGEAQLILSGEGPEPARLLRLREGDAWSIPSRMTGRIACLGSQRVRFLALVRAGAGIRTSADIGTSAGDSDAGVPSHRREGDDGPQERGYCHRKDAQPARQTDWGTLRVIEGDRFHDPDAPSAALVALHPGCSTGLHWHLNTATWHICLEGCAALTCLDDGGRSRETGFVPGTVLRTPRARGYSMRNTGRHPLLALEIFQSDHYHDLSLPEWLACCPAEEIAAYLRVDLPTLRHFAQL
ncbi:cupin domain-containing protein [Swaminathania salitolerans]|uniref:Cupin type-1 domain-containing protein n=1 Tax=Swaminathania salitolerans TaxID=182838 RepID=A0A511BKT8_9PROT|nr:cupin domain-containing protein [Swaminathania salitolerans]GBQ09469.1 hypothetical protein AA21291_0082 [Swaminathania salitolerans LMG 21291]GEL00961.1 hypothetical protein SSA02_01240 [Swaminathania salitolerans]